jgi:hypothetical protein
MSRLFFDGSIARIRRLPVLSATYLEAFQWKTACDPFSFGSVNYFLPGAAFC